MPVEHSRKIHQRFKSSPAHIRNKMATIADLQPRVGHTMRIRITGDDGFNKVEYLARLERIGPDPGTATFHVGYTYLHPKLTNIEIIEGGLQNTSTGSNPEDEVII